MVKKIIQNKTIELEMGIEREIELERGSRIGEGNRETRTSVSCDSKICMQFFCKKKSTLHHEKSKHGVIVKVRRHIIDAGTAQSNVSELWTDRRLRLDDPLLFFAYFLSPSHTVSCPSPPLSRGWRMLLQQQLRRRRATRSLQLRRASCLLRPGLRARNGSLPQER